MAPHKDHHKDHENSRAKLLADGGAWFMNVSSSVAIIFVNKVAMDPTWGYKFVFGEQYFLFQQQQGTACPPSHPHESPAATCLCAMHYMVSFGAIRVFLACGMGEQAHVPFRGGLLYSPHQA